MSLKQLMEELSKYMNGQQPQQAAQGSGSQPSGGGPQGTQQAGGNSNFSLEELLAEMQKRQQEAAEREQNFAQMLRNANPARSAGGQLPNNGGQSNVVQQLVGLAPIDLGQNLSIGAGGPSFSSGGGMFG